jgi:gamma-glutamyltranspeptidase / glutathione hydrolase
VIQRFQEKAHKFGMKISCSFWLLLISWVQITVTQSSASTVPVRAQHGMVVAQDEIAAEVGRTVLVEGGNAMDAAVATAFALAVTHPAAGNIGGGGFLVYRSGGGESVAYDFRETAPAGVTEGMFLRDGQYDRDRHQYSHLAVGVPGTVAGLHLAWKEQGKLPWDRLLEPAVKLAREGFTVSPGLAQSLRDILPEMRRYPGSWLQFSKRGAPYAAGDILRQPDLAKTLMRIAAEGPDGFYRGETAALIEREMAAHGGLITRADLAGYKAKKRVPVIGNYRGYEIISMPPPSSGGIALVQMLNILEEVDLKRSGFGSAETVHWMVESMRRAFADRARHLGDPDFNPEMPVARLISKEYAAELRETIRPDRASKSAPDRFEWPREGEETTHLSVVDLERNAVALTYTLEQSYGSRIVAPGTGFLLNNEMGDFNPVPGLTTREGMIGTRPNLAEPGKRMLSSMTPTIVAKDGELFMVTGSPGGRTIINTVLLTIVNAIDFEMNIQQAVDAPRFHHQWLPDLIRFERHGLSPDTVKLLEAMGHELRVSSRQGVAAAIWWDAQKNWLEGAADRRAPDSAAQGH